MMIAPIPTATADLNRCPLSSSKCSIKVISSLDPPLLRFPNMDFIMLKLVSVKVGQLSIKEKPRYFNLRGLTYSKKSKVN
jgi:hypothetical protein